MKNLYFASLLFIFSCAQNFSLNEKTITQYQDHDLQNFIKERFIERSGLEGALAKINEALPDSKEDSDFRKFLKKNFIYKAYYTSNTVYLSMPKRDLELFCKIKGGNFILTKSINGNFVRDKYSAAIGEAIKNNEIADHNQLQEFNYYSGSNSAVAGYQDGINNGYFGEFECHSAASSELIWKVAIYPLGFVPKKYMSQTDAHTLFLQIVPLE